MTATATEMPQPVASGATPRVNLMPPEIAEGARLRQVQFIAGLVVVLALVIVVLLYLRAHRGMSDAQNALDQAQQQQTSLQEKLNSLAPVKQTFADVQSKQALLSEAMGDQVRWSYVLNDISLRMPSDVFLVAIDISQTGAPGTAPPAQGSTPTQIGTISFSGVGFKHDDVATWLDAIAKVRGFLNATFTNSSEAATGNRSFVTFGSSVDLMSNLYSYRYVPAASPTPGAPATLPAPSAPAGG